VAHDSMYTLYVKRIAFKNLYIVTEDMIRIICFILKGDEINLNQQ
jgi:hypothetical protein